MAVYKSVFTDTNPGLFAINRKKKKGGSSSMTSLTPTEEQEQNDLSTGVVDAAKLLVATIQVLDERLKALESRVSALEGAQ
jgi:hypothetical protein